MTDGWTQTGRHCEILDPKGETVLLKALAAAAAYRALPEAAREEYASRFRVFDVTDDRVTPTDLWTVTVPELLLLEEVGVLVKQPAVADYLLEASRTLRWKALSILCVAQDSANAIPKETVTALVLNSKWLLVFECGKEEAMWLLPHMADGGKSEAEERRAFIAEMAKLPIQHAVFVRKGLPGLRLRLRDVPDPTRASGRAELMETFTRQIAARSMVRIRDAEEKIVRFEAALLEAKETPITKQQERAAASVEPTSLDDFFAFLDRERRKRGGS
ncbi:MAG TPA: hypothetical protein VJ276_07530 [Thermoanaerobaculia bacterium]|nr:hypothetical protein [Thermoanaerobaculia bacterium]